MNIHDGIDSTLSILAHRLQASSTCPEIQVIKAYGQLPLVECYAGQLNQVFMNILSNAIDALRRDSKAAEATSEANLPYPDNDSLPRALHNSNFNPQTSTLKLQPSNFNPQTSTLSALPTIWIYTEEGESDRITIRMIDNGTGIPLPIQKRLFDPFFTTKPVGRGIGLGLAISHHIVVEKHQGELRCISEPGMGTEFVVEIPVKQL